MSNFPEAPSSINTPDRDTTLADFAYLWQTDNPDWVAQREADWLSYVKPIFKEHPKAEQKLLENYFKRGIKAEYYPESAWFLLTPYDSVDTLRKIINSAMLGAGCRRNLSRRFLTGFQRFSDCPWYQKHITLYIQAYLTDGYTLITEKRTTVSPPPTYWCRGFVNESIIAINENAAWSPFYLCLDYFVSILPFAFLEDTRKEIDLVKLMHLVDNKLAQKNHDTAAELQVFLHALKAREQDIWQAWQVGEQKIAAGMKAPREG